MGNSSVIFNSKHGEQVEKTTEHELENEMIRDQGFRCLGLVRCVTQHECSQ